MSVFFIWLLSVGSMFVPGAPTPSNKTALQSFVDQSVSASLTKYLEGKEDPGREYFATYLD